MDNDYIMQFKIKNAPMLKIMRINGMETAADLSRACGIGQRSVGEYLNLKKPPLNLKGEWRLDVMKISETLKTIPELLFPEQHYANALENNSAEVELYSNDVRMFIGKEYAVSPEDELLQEGDIFPEDLLDEFGGRERKIIEYKFGLNGRDEKSLRQIGDRFSISPERVRQLIEKTLRKLRHPCRANKIRRLKIGEI